MGFEPFLDRLDARERAAVESCWTRRSYGKGDVVIFHGGSVGDVLIIESGHIKLTVAATDGREVLIDIRGPGEIIGEMALIDDSQRSANAFALSSPTDVFVVPVADFRTLLDNEIGITRAVLNEMVQKVRATTFHQLEYGLDDVAGRLSRRLHELGLRFGRVESDESISLRSPITQQELADWCGVSRQAVVKELALMRRAGWLETKGSRMVIRDPAAVQARAAALLGGL